MKNFLMAVVTLCIGSLASAEMPLPANFSDFEKLSFEQMKNLPDYKWELAKPVKDADLKNKSETEVILFRNSIYAQHGFRFSQKPLANYFLSRSWYKPSLESLNTDKLSPLSRKNVEFFMKHQASLKQPERDVASKFGQPFDMIAYHIFKMGFCTYDVGSEKKAGLVVFEPAGKAKVFHSKASRAAFEPYAYNDYLDDSTGHNGPMLLEASWKIQGGSVLLDFNEEVYERMGATLARGTRKVLSVSANESSLNAIVRNRSCTMEIQK